MADEYQIRKQKAEQINEALRDISEGVLIIGSVAYNPKSVNEKSDLDMLVILDFSAVDFEELYSKLGQKYEPILAKYAKESKINTLSIVYEEPNFEVGIHVWSTEAFQRVVDLEKYNTVFRRKDFSKSFESTANIDPRRNLRGIEKVFDKEPKDVKGGTILKFCICEKDSSDFYIGIPVLNLLYPVVLSEKDETISNGLRRFKINLISELRSVYGSSTKHHNLFNSLSDKLKVKVGKDLEIKLKNYF